MYRLEAHPNTLSNSSATAFTQDNVNLILEVVKAIREEKTVPNFDGRRDSPAGARAHDVITPESLPSVRQHTFPDVSTTTSASEGDRTTGSSQTHAQEFSGSPPTEITTPTHSPNGASSSVQSSSIAGGTLSRRSSRRRGVSPGEIDVAEQRESGRNPRRPGAFPEETSVAETRPLRRPLFELGPPSELSITRMQDREATSESSFVDVRPSEGVFKMITSQNFTRLAGRLERGDGRWKQVSGVLEPKQTFNFITVSLVSDLDLLTKVDQSAAENDNCWVETLSGKFKPMGRIQVRWRSSHLRPISILFWVLPGHHESRSLVLGEPFATKSRHYMRSSRADR